MPLGLRASNPIDIEANVPIFCHTATLYWILQENAGGGRDPIETLMAIGGLTPGAQVRFGDMQKSGTWDFTITPSTPPVGTVLYWPQTPTHTAVVTGANQISGYNQNCVFTTAAAGTIYATCTPNAIRQGMTRCNTIAEDISLAFGAMLGI